MIFRWNIILYTDFVYRYTLSLSGDYLWATKYAPWLHVAKRVWKRQSQWTSNSQVIANRLPKDCLWIAHELPTDCSRIAHKLHSDCHGVPTKCPRSLFGLPTSYLLIICWLIDREMLTDCRRISYGLLKGFNSFLKLQNAFNDSAFKRWS